MAYAAYIGDWWPGRENVAILLFECMCHDATQKLSARLKPAERQPMTIQTTRPPGRGATAFPISRCRA